MSTFSSTIGDRLREERDRIGLSQAAFAKEAGASRNSQVNYEANKSNPGAAYWTAIATFLKVDVQYVLTEVPSANLDEIGELTEEEKAARRDRMTKKVMQIAEGCTRQPDPLKLGPVRDLALSAHLRDDQIKVIFDLLEQAGKPDFWLGTENKKGEKGK